MKLTHVEIKNYRSVVHNYADNRSFTMELGDGVNSITGPNNAGKSNILRALSLALDEDFEFDRQADMPAMFPAASKPVVTLTFQIPLTSTPSREATLLRRLEKYEREVHPNGRATYASKGEVRLRVAIEGGEETRGVRRRTFVVRGGGNRSLADDDPIAIKSLEQFDSCLQFILVRSGESLESLLKGRFREVLRTILREGLRDEFDEAVRSREEYVSALQGGLLLALRERIHDELTELFPEVTSVSLEPDVRALDETLTEMRVEVTDAAITDLADKGTGVRGGLIVAMLQHLAHSTKRSVVMAVEEPESFLHPAAQEELRTDLETLAVRGDVTLAVTTHSPYIVSRLPQSRAFAIQKVADGRTELQCTANGDEPLDDALGGLYRNSLVLGFIERSASAPDHAAGVLVVEGYTDRSWLVLAAERAGRAELVSDLSIVTAGEGLVRESGGAALALTQALILKSTSSAPVGVLFDNDAPGCDARATLRGINDKTKNWAEKRFVFGYDMAFDPSFKAHPFEAEDLWPTDLYRRFLAGRDEEEYLSGKIKRPKGLGGWTYDFIASAKSELDAFFVEHVKAEDCTLWIQLLELIRGGLKLPEGDQ